MKKKIIVFSCALAMFLFVGANVSFYDEATDSFKLSFSLTELKAQMGIESGSAEGVRCACRHSTCRARVFLGARCTMSVSCENGEGNCGDEDEDDEISSYK